MPSPSYDLLRGALKRLSDLSALGSSFAKYQQLQVAQFRQQLLNTEKYQHPKCLNRYEKQVFSQNGEDGIIAEIFKRIGTQSKTFVEIGAGGGLENNTLLLLLQGWSGYWLEGNARAVRDIQREFREPIASRQLTVLEGFITAENIQSILEQAGLPAEFDFLSIDIDRNTYWIWNALPAFRPRLVVVEYNALFPAEMAWRVSYHANRTWNGSTYYGASLKAYEQLGNSLGYNLVGCDLTGVNAFFVRQDLCEDHFLKPFTSEQHYEPIRYYLAKKGPGTWYPTRFQDDD